MATAKVISHSFDIHRDGVTDGVVTSPASILLAKWNGKDVHVSIPVTRQGRPDVGSEIEITDPVEQFRPRFNAHGVPIEGTKTYAANLLSKTAAALVPRPKAHVEKHEKK